MNFRKILQTLIISTLFLVGVLGIKQVKAVSGNDPPPTAPSEVDESLRIDNSQIELVDVSTNYSDTGTGRITYDVNITNRGNLQAGSFFDIEAYFQYENQKHKELYSSDLNNVNFGVIDFSSGMTVAELNGTRLTFNENINKSDDMNLKLIVTDVASPHFYSIRGSSRGGTSLAVYINNQLVTEKSIDIEGESEFTYGIRSIGYYHGFNPEKEEVKVELTKAIGSDTPYFKGLKQGDVLEIILKGYEGNSSHSKVEELSLSVSDIYGYLLKDSGNIYRRIDYTEDLSRFFDIEKISDTKYHLTLKQPYLEMKASYITIKGVFYYKLESFHGDFNKLPHYPKIEANKILETGERKDLFGNDSMDNYSVPAGTGEYLRSLTNPIIEEEVVEEEIPYDKIYQYNPKLGDGFEDVRIIQEGVVGKKSITYQVKKKRSTKEEFFRKEINREETPKVDEIYETGLLANAEDSKTIPFKTIYRANNNKEVGYKEEVISGEEGISANVGVQYIINEPQKEGEPFNGVKVKDGVWTTIKEPVDQVIEVGTKVVDRKETPFQTIYKRTPTLPKGKEEVFQVGEIGVTENIYQITIDESNGEEVSRELASTTETPKKDHIILVGMGLPNLPKVGGSLGGIVLFISSVLLGFGTFKKS